MRALSSAERQRRYRAKLKPKAPRPIGRVRRTLAQPAYRRWPDWITSEASASG